MGKWLRRLGIAFMLYYGLSSNIFAKDTKEITGLVYAHEKKINTVNELYNATVSLFLPPNIKAHNQTITDSLGRFSFVIPDTINEWRYTISHVGYEQLDTLTNEEYISLPLKPQLVIIPSIVVSSTNSIGTKNVNLNTDLEYIINKSAFDNPSSVIGDPIIAASEAPVATRTTQTNAMPEILGGKRHEVKTSIHNITLALDTKLGTAVGGGIGEMMESVSVNSDGSSYSNGGLSGTISMTPSEVKQEKTLHTDVSFGMAFYKGAFSKPIAGFGVQAGVFGTYGQILEQIYDVNIPQSRSFESTVNRDKTYLGNFDIYTRMIRGSIDDGVSKNNSSLETSNHQDIIILRNTPSKPISHSWGIMDWDISLGLQNNVLSANNNAHDPDALVDLTANMQTFTLRPELKLVFPWATVKSFYEGQIEKTSINGTLSPLDLGDGASFHQSFEAMSIPTHDMRHRFATKVTKEVHENLTLDVSGALQRSSLFGKTAASYSIHTQKNWTNGIKAKIGYASNASWPSNQEWMQRRIFFTDAKSMQPEKMQQLSFHIAKQIGRDVTASIILSGKQYSNRYLAIEPDIWSFVHANRLPDYSPESLSLLAGQEHIIIPDYDIMGVESGVRSALFNITKGERESNLLFGSLTAGYQKAWDVLPQRSIVAYTQNQLFVMDVPKANAKNNQHYGFYIDASLGINVIRNKLDALMYFERRSGWRKSEEHLVNIPDMYVNAIPELNGPLYYRLQTSNNTHPIGMVETLSLGLNGVINDISVMLYAYDIENLIMGDKDVVMERYNSPYAIEQLTQGHLIQEKKTPGYVTITFSKKFGF